MTDSKASEATTELAEKTAESPTARTPSALMTAEGVKTDESISESKDPQHKRQTWGSGVQFLLTCISFAVGLGNIWRFPALVYENGGGTFLIPYFCCSMIVGFPVLYLELSLGQFARAGPSVVYGRIKPFFHGVGWTMVVNSFITGIYYNIVVAWSLIYMVMVIIQQSHKWMYCRNDFNTIYCQSLKEDDRCSENLGMKAFYFNQSCYKINDTAALNLRNETFTISNPVSPTEEFFDNVILQRSPTAEDLSPNWIMFGAYFGAFFLSAVAMYKGPKILGKLSYITAVVPYIIIAILFGRAITLDGKDRGLAYYLFEFKWDVLYNGKTWQAAATQVCFSLSPGFGGILSYATYNRKDHNVYRDAFIIAAADSFMSVFGGTAVFCVLGFMSKSLNVGIDQVVKDGTALAFVAYPEAMGWLPIPEFWLFIFFLMLFLLGVSSEFGYLECVITALADQIPILHRNKGFTTIGVCFVSFICGLAMCTRSGFYYFNLLNDYAAGFSITACLLFESALIAHCYGIRNYLKDLRSMFGPPKHLLAKIFGPTGFYVQFIWFVASPLLWGLMTGVTLYKQIMYHPSVGRGLNKYDFPDWLVGIGWAVSVIPFFTIPGFLIYNCVYFKQQDKSLTELWKCQPEWPAFKEQRPEEAKRLKAERAKEREAEKKAASNKKTNPEDDKTKSM